MDNRDDFSILHAYIWVNELPYYNSYFYNKLPYATRISYHSIYNTYLCLNRRW